MWYLDETRATIEENVALDEALLDQAEAAGQPHELLRLWEPRDCAVVLGRSSSYSAEAQVAACQRRQIPIIRRTSGGAAILTGPGCLMYALVLSYDRRPELRALDQAHALVLDQQVRALSRLLPDVERQGTSDLTWRGRKFSGNSLRCKRNHLLYHGTLLYDFPLQLIGECLGLAPRQPTYRDGRDHDAFVANLPISAAAISEQLKAVWQADQPLPQWPLEQTRALAAGKYRSDNWNQHGHAT